MGDPSGLTEEIRSHMTFLNNELLAKIIALNARNQYEASLSLAIPDIQGFRSALDTLYTSVHCVLKDEERKKIEEALDKYKETKTTILTNKRYQNTKNCETLLDILSKTLRYILDSLQTRRFLFRLELPTHKLGLEGAVKLVHDAKKAGRPI